MSCMLNRTPYVPVSYPLGHISDFTAAANTVLSHFRLTASWPKCMLYFLNFVCQVSQTLPAGGGGGWRKCKGDLHLHISLRQTSTNMEREKLRIDSSQRISSYSSKCLGGIELHCLQSDQLNNTPCSNPSPSYSFLGVSSQINHLHTHPYLRSAFRGNPG